MYTLEKVWPEWKVVKEIGRGSYGVVYKCVKEEKNRKKYAAIKVISVPRDEFEMDDVVSERMTQEQSKAYYKDIADDLLKEIEILKSLKGTKNIVEIYDAKVVEKEDGIGWNIFISMEMLTDFTTYASDKKFTQEDVIKLGTDLCSALSVCHKARIIHRDIKPENIFVDDFGNFKLGDFGVAKQMAKTKGSVSVKGTYGYMSPEVFSGKKCDGRADLYSLALVMYKLLNNNRFPFIDSGKQIVKYSERQQAFERRIKGESIPAIKGISSDLNAVILKACSFRNVDRQKNIDEFRKQLESVGKGKKSGNKAKIAIAAAAAVVVLVSAVTGAVQYTKYKQSLENENAAADTNITEEAERNIINTISLDEERIGDNPVLIKSLGDNEEQYYLVRGNDIVENLSELPGIEKDYKIHAYAEGKLYYSVEDPKKDKENNFDVYSYDIEEKISSVEPCINNVDNFDSILYITDNYVYVFTDESKKLAMYDRDGGIIDNSTVEAVFEYNGYIIYSIGGKTYVYCDAAANEKFIHTNISSNVVEGTKMYPVGDKLYFAEETENGNIAIKYFDFEKEEKIAENSDQVNEDAVSELTDGEEAALVEDEETTLVADIGDADQNISGASWKIVGSFNDKYAVVRNENARDGENSWYIWCYKPKGNDNKNELHPIENADTIFVEGNYEIYTDKDTSERIMVTVWEDYIYKIYEIADDGVALLYRNMFAEGKKDGSYRMGKNYFTIDSNTIKSAKTIDKVDFKQKEELVNVKSGAKVYKVPDDIDDYIAENKLSEYNSYNKLAENEEWIKVKVNEEIVYIKRGDLKVKELSDVEKNKLISEVEEMYVLKDVNWVECINSGDNYTVIFTAKNDGNIPYNVTLRVDAVLKNGNWEFNKIDENRKASEEIKAFYNYLKYPNKDGKPNIDPKAYNKLSFYDINNDGVYELIASKNNKHAIFIYNKNETSDKVKRLSGMVGEHTFYSKDGKLYRIKDSGDLCYKINSSEDLKETTTKPTTTEKLTEPNETITYTTTPNVISNKPKANIVVIGVNVGDDIDVQKQKLNETELYYSGIKSKLEPIFSFDFYEYKNELSAY